MVTFSAKIQKAVAASGSSVGGWSYVIIKKSLAEKLNPGCKKSFRIKGLLDNFKIKQVSILPVGGGDFMLPINATLRKGTGKKAGDTLKLQVELDKQPKALSADLVSCLKDDPQAYDFFKKLPNRVCSVLTLEIPNPTRVRTGF